MATRAVGALWHPAVEISAAGKILLLPTAPQRRERRKAYPLREPQAPVAPATESAARYTLVQRTAHSTISSFTLLCISACPCPCFSAPSPPSDAFQMPFAVRTMILHASTTLSLALPMPPDRELRRQKPTTPHSEQR